MTEEAIKRINELYKKSKTKEGLTKFEREEQQLLRRAYIDDFKNMGYSQEYVERVLRLFE